MTYQVIARKYRPQTFDEIIGQEPIVRTLKNALEQNLVAHAYIFSGMRGVGKTTTARILAKALNCQKGPTTKPCGLCPACREITASRAIDVLEVDAASTGRVEEIRELLQTARYVPARDPYKVFIIDEAHMLSKEACNALLKTLEEPPQQVVFILATTEPHKIIPTIHSRCQSFLFRSISFQEILELLGRLAAQEGAQVEPEALAVMARAAEGSLRDALSVLDQAIAYGGPASGGAGKTITATQARELLGVVSGEVLDELVAAVAEASSERILRLVDRLERDGHNLQHFCGEALRHIRNLLLVRIGGAAAKLAEAAGLERQRLEASASHFSEEDLLRFFKVLLDTEGELRQAPQPRLHLELGLLKLAQAERLVPLEEVLAELTGASRREPLPAHRSPQDVGGPARLSPAVNPAPAPPAAAAAPTAAVRSEAGPRPAGPVLEPETIEAIQSAVFAQSKFLGSFVESVARWERHPDSLTLWFPSDSRTLVDMLDKKQQAQLEKIISGVLAAPVKVFAKVGAVEPARRSPQDAGGPAPVSAVADNPNNPVVKALLDRFGGSVRRASELPARRSPQDAGGPPRRRPEEE